MIVILLGVKTVLHVERDLTLSLSVHNRPLSAVHNFWEGLPKRVFSAEDVQLVVKKLTAPWWSICEGNNDEQFQKLLPDNAVLCDNQMQTKAYKEGNMGAQYTSTIRTVNCQFLVRNDKRCCHCKVYRRTLWSKAYRDSKSENDNAVGLRTSRVAHCSMSRAQLHRKIKDLQDENKSLSNIMDKMRRDILKEIAQKGHDLNDIDNSDMLQLLRNHKSGVEKAFPNENSLPKVLWEQQLKCAQGKSTGIRWHPMIIKWCLYIHNVSSKAYDAMRETGFLVLPSSRTLFDYSNYLPNTNGFSTQCAIHLKEEAEKLGLFEHEWKSYVGILQDEVQINQSLVYDRHTGNLIGYVDLNETANELDNLHKCMNEKSNQVATNMLVVMVRGAVTSLKYPFACFATTGATGEYLCSIIWEAVRILELVCNLKVIFVTCDGATPNRKFFKYNAVTEEGYWCWNRYSFPRRKLYFISDVPHLMKTARNCFANSSGHRRTRTLWKNGFELKWQHIVDLYTNHVEGKIFSETHKLTRNHVNLTAFNQMKVKFAVQVLSKTVADSLEKNYGRDVSENVSFIKHMNRFFALFKCETFEGKCTEKESMADLKAFTDLNDERLYYLRNDFLGYFQDWYRSMLTLTGTYTHHRPILDI
ncbi:uncharacterized protein [Littorina saxatilis]|uniref:uncharacterized protein n=1 Tax=Littorina saxatilis TaxID=31220 RepID=UPI0038B643DC